MMSDARRLGFAFLLLTLAFGSLRAQAVPGGSVDGIVSDPQHLAVSQAAIELRSDQGRVLQTVASDQAGHYVLQSPGPGHYSVRFAHQGFKTLDREITVLQATTELSVELEVGDASQTLTVREEPLMQPVSTSSRLDLLPIDTPASVAAISSETIAQRGYQLVEEAVRSMPGAYGGGTPEAPSEFVVRGFSNNQIVLLRDGIYAGPAGMITRPQNPFNLQSIELLSGPSSVLYGQGAIGGTINEITKPATFSPIRVDGFASYGSFNSYTLGLGVGGQIARTVAFRADLSYASSGGYVHGSDSYSLNGTASLVWKPRSNLSVKLALDALKDQLPSYYGTPYVPATFTPDPLKGVVQTSDGTVIDARMRYNNYDVNDNKDYAQTFLPSGTLHWEPVEGLSITNEFYFFHAIRDFADSETYTFLGPNSGAVDATGKPIPGNVVARDRFTVYHKENLPGDTFNVNLQRRIFGMENKLSGGFQYYNVSFLRLHGGPAATYYDYVDPLNPVRGTDTQYGAFATPASPTTLNDKGGFFEDALTPVRRLTIVAGARFDSVYLDRINYNAAGAFVSSSSFQNTYGAVNYRIGAVYRLASFLTPYAQASTGQDPAGSSNIFTLNASQNFKLSSSTQVEAGLKSIFPRGLGESTLALYSIERKNTLTQTALDVVSNVGSQRSRGIEFSTVLRPMHLLSVNFNTAYTGAKYEYFLDTSTGASYAGNHPPNVPSTTSNLWVNREGVAGLKRLDLGGGFHFVGTRYANNTNTTKLLSYGTVDIYANYRVSEKVTLSLRCKNLLDKAYGLWADTTYPTELFLGPPRSVEVSVRSRF